MAITYQSQYLLKLFLIIQELTQAFSLLLIKVDTTWTEYITLSTLAILVMKKKVLTRFANM